MKHLVFLTLVLSFSTLGSIKKKNFGNLKDNLSVQRSKIQKISSAMKTLEKNIGSKNKDYLSKLEMLNELMDRKVEIQTELQVNSKEIKKEKVRIKNVFDKYKLLRFTNSPKKMLERAYVKKAFILKMKSLEDLKQENIILSKQINLIGKKVNSIKDIEENLQSLILEMEDEKKELVQAYQTESHLKTKIELELSRLKLEKIAKTKYPNKKSRRTFEYPIKDFQKYKKGKKGITFLYDDTTSVLAPERGEVVYNGELANYGHVIMIDHGQGIRSVLLGSMKAKVKKGDQIQKGDLIAYAKKVPKGEGLYFEIRKQNKAKNVLSYLNISNRKRI